MDHNVSAAQRLQDDHEAASELACHAAAQQAGFTPGQADDCEDGQHQCPACPWRKPADVDHVDRATQVAAVDPNSWEANAQQLLERCPFTVWQRPGGGPVDLKASLVVTFMGMQSRLQGAPMYAGNPGAGVRRPVGAGLLRPVCPDCSVAAGQLHVAGCDVERCPDCGEQALSCGHARQGLKRPRLPWTGQWPGDAECKEFGWWSCWSQGTGWVRCDASHPQARPDINRLAVDAVWDAQAGRFVRREEPQEG